MQEVIHDEKLTMKQICDEWKTSTPTIYRYIRAGKFPPGEPAGLRAVRWRRSSVESAFVSMFEGKRP